MKLHKKCQFRNAVLAIIMVILSSLSHIQENPIGLVGINALSLKNNGIVTRPRDFRLYRPFNVSNCPKHVVQARCENTILIKGRKGFKTEINRSTNLCSVVESNQEFQMDEEVNEKEFCIRNAEYGDLGTVTSLIVKAFYPPSPFMKFFRQLKELDRLQSNFPYNDPNHSMYVAVSKKTNEVLGFVDIDFRETKRRYAPPRPYLSDLVVGEKWRRRGIARDLILQCERKVLELKKKTLFLRVEIDNEKALKMYFSLGYDFEPSKIFGVIDTTILLKRNLQIPRPQYEPK